MKRIALLSALFLFLAFIVTPALAVNTSGDRISGSSKAAERKAAIQDKMEVKASDRSASLQERAAKEIDRRIASLEKLLTKISEFKKLSTTQKATLTSQVQSEINTLTALKDKIAADTDQATLKTDVQSIVSAYRIYAVFLPKIQILGAADRLLTIADEMTTQATMLEEKIATEASKGTDVSDADALLADMKAKIADAKVQAQSAIDTANGVIPEGYPDNKTDLKTARQYVVTALKDLQTARQDGRKIIVWLVEKNGGPLKSASSSASKINK